MNAKAIAGKPITRPLSIAAFGLLLIVAIWLASYVPNADWSGTYDGAARAIFHGRSPYAQALFVNPPWTVLLLAPFAAFPPSLARGLILVCTVAAWIYTAWRLQAPRMAVIALLVSPTAIGALLAANLDALVLLGVFLPATVGLFVLLIKPQIGLGAAIYDLVEAWRRGRLTGVLFTFAPVVIALAASAILFPAWVERLVQKPANEWNRSLFPYGIPLGLLLLWLSIRRRNVMFGLAASPFLAPYLTFPGYLIVQLGLLHPDVERVVPRVWLQLGLCVFLWIIMLVFRL